MALQRAKLKGGMHGVFSSTSGPSVVADRLSAAYYEYARAAKSCGAPGTPVPAALSAARGRLRLALTGVFGTTYQNPIDFARNVAMAFGAFWLLPPVAFAGTTPGLVTVAVRLPLQLAILAFLTYNAGLARAGSGPGTDQVETQWATALDSWTRSIIVTHAPPSACALPLT